MFIISLIAQKGGSGKTTIALHLAVRFFTAGMNTVVLDLDPQASATEWYDAREQEMPHVEAVVPSRLNKKLEQFREAGAEVVILDTAPHSESTAVDAARVANLVLVPFKPSIMDIRALSKTIEILKLVKAEAWGVMNGVQAHSIQSAEQAADTVVNHLGLRVMAQPLGERVAYSRCLIDGRTAEEYEPDGKATNEFFGLYQLVLKELYANGKA